jgi:DNA-damage-inducible protein J
MTRDDTLHVRVNGDIKRQAEEVFARLGISLSDAVNMFLAQSALNKGMPFRPEIPDSAPESVIVHSEEELAERLDRAEKHIAEGKVYPAEAVFAEMRAKYCGKK